MTKIKFNGVVKGLSGRVGDLIFRQMPDGSTVVSQAPRGPKTDFSEKQLKQQDRFQQAVLYARQAAKDQPIYAELAEKTRTNTAYSLALADWMKPPVIRRIQREEGRILVDAIDNVLVEKVVVTIFDESGEILETGEATRLGGNWWEFASHTEGKTIKAEAWDLPGHVTEYVV